MANGFRKRTTTFLFIMVVCVLLVFLARAKYLEKPNGALAFLYIPVATAFKGYADRINYLIDTVKNIDKFKNENSAIKKENYELAQKASKFYEVERENQVLRKQLDFSEKSCVSGSCLEWEMGRVVSLSPTNYEKYIIIDVGSKDGVYQNQAAVYAGGILVGKVSEVYEHTSKVSLLTSSSSTINVITQKSRSNGVVKGRYSTGVRLEMINQNEELEQGELIVTSGLENGIPKGLLVGKTSTIEESANRIFKEADVDLFVDFNKIEEVFIAK